MKKRRVFIAINLPDDIKEKLAEFRDEWPELPARWTKKENLHITLSFLGYLTDEELLEVVDSVKKIAQKHQPFEILLNRICLGPPHRPARMIWLEGETNQELIRLRNDLEKTEQREFRTHITLARLKQSEWRNLREKPEIEKDISLSFPVESIEIMESVLSPKGPTYFILEKIQLK